MLNCHYKCIIVLHFKILSTLKIVVFLIKLSGVYRPRALPSAGLFPFVRSFLCDFKDTKTNDSNELLNGLPNLRSSRYMQIKVLSVINNTGTLNFKTH